MEEALGPNDIKAYEKKRVLNFIFRKLTFGNEVYEFRKEPPQELVDLIVPLLQEICDMLDFLDPIDKEHPVNKEAIEKNKVAVMKYYHTILQYI